ncbi:MAG: DEAD/DEAH box helicase [Anaerolineaceae bacterium]|nr:DEAD/DEAH box helicase [Anaerolineaceae bacterium]
MATFEELGLEPQILEAVEKSGYTEPTPIQAQAIPLLNEGKDILGQAQTGTGKTAAFALPMIQKLDRKNKHIQGLVLTPTRELAVQVSDAIKAYGKFSKLKVAPVYGGQSYQIQLRKLKEGVQIVVGTPGRVIDLIQKKALDFSQVSFLVLDEADEMLNMGFIDDVETILEETPENRQTALFSATMHKTILKLASKHLNDPIKITVDRKKLTVDKIKQSYYLLKDKDKELALTRLIDFEGIEHALIFTRTKVRAAELADTLAEYGYQAEALHGDLKQSTREQVLNRFRRKPVSFLVATSVAARGLDIDDISHVINIDIPYDPEDYVHRIGRTGRAGKEGTAITFVTPSETRRIASIERYTSHKLSLAKPPSIKAIKARRDEKFTQNIIEKLMADNPVEELNVAQQLVQWGYDPLDIAAAAIKLARSAEPPIDTREIKGVKPKEDRSTKPRFSDNGNKPHKKRRSRKQEAGMVKFSMNLGHLHKISPGQIVGAIASGAGIPGGAIGSIDIHEKNTYLDISEKYVSSVSKKMGNWKIKGQPAKLRKAEPVA